MWGIWGVRIWPLIGCVLLIGCICGSIVGAIDRRDRRKKDEIKRMLSTFPTWELKVDVSGKRMPDFDIEILDKLRTTVTRYDLWNADKKMRAWSQQMDGWVLAIKSKRYREYALSVLTQVLRFDRAFHIVVLKKQTRYRQTNYVKSPYSVNVILYQEYLSYDEIMDTWEKAYDGDYMLTSEFMQEQRRLMTPALRKYIMERDNYTCQHCGKMMFDEVGLHIDHIVPISKGGRSVPENLQVLCSKCNGAKGNRLDEC